MLIGCVWLSLPAAPPALRLRDASRLPAHRTTWGSADVQRQRVNARGQIAKRLVNGTVTRHPAHARKLCCADRHVEMRFSPLAPAAMATMFLAIILYFQNFRLERLGQSLKNLVFHSHFCRCPLHAATQCFNVGAPSLKGLP